MFGSFRCLIDSIDSVGFTLSSPALLYLLRYPSMSARTCLEAQPPLVVPNNSDFYSNSNSKDTNNNNNYSDGQTPLIPLSSSFLELSRDIGNQFPFYDSSKLSGNDDIIIRNININY